MRLQRLGRIKKLDDDRIAVRQVQDAPVALAAGGEEKIVRLAKQQTVAPGAVGDGRNIDVAENSVGNLAAERLQHGEFLRTGFALGLHIGVLKVGDDALIERIGDV